MLACLNSQPSLKSAVRLNTFNLFCRLSLFAENRLSLPTIAIGPVITPLPLRTQGVLALVLCCFVRLVPTTLPPERLAGFRDVHHICKSAIGKGRTVFLLMKVL